MSNKDEESKELLRTALRAIWRREGFADELNTIENVQVRRLFQDNRHNLREFSIQVVVDAITEKNTAPPR